MEEAADPEIECIVDDELVLENESVLLQDLVYDCENLLLEGWVVNRAEYLRAKWSLEELGQLLEALADASGLWLGLLLNWAFLGAAGASDQIGNFVSIGVACRVGSHQECSEKVEHECDVLEFEGLR